ncbi:FAD-binding protein [Rhodobacterales bacterium HKCCE3408]|nr:FAD-binding protein [Rhodobacterales bacterium HKCCE3408]
MNMPPTPPARARSFSAARAALEDLFGDRFSVNRTICEQHANTTTWIAPDAPDAVAFPVTSGEVQAAVRICAASGVPVIGFGAGSSFEGHVNAPLGGLCLDMSRMNRVLAVHPEDLDCVVEPGVTRRQLEAELRDRGLFFPVDPGADATLGGMASTRASGTMAVQHGTMMHNVIAMKVVLPDGELISTGRRARKSAAGYDLTRLFIGAEGTLGIITELTLKLQGIPEATSSGVCSFPDVRTACSAAIAAIQAGIPVARVEFVDEVQIGICNAYSKMDLPEVPHLFVEFCGSANSVREQSALFGDIVRDHGGGEFAWALQSEDRRRLWRGRHDVFWAAKSFRPGASVIVTDVCVPVSRLAECLAETRADIDRFGLIAPIVGHVGDGNFHTMPLIRMDDAEEVARASAFLERLSHRALSMEGTCTGEHGIGTGKKGCMAAEHGDRGVELMRTIKRAIDPGNIMNPGKVV